MPLRKPPARLAAPNTFTLRAGASLHRVHDRAYKANDFSPCRGASTRFAPIHDEAGVCVPSLYAGDTLEAAIYETIFHDVPVKVRRKTVPKSLVQSRSHGVLEVLRDLELVSLRTPDLKKWRISRSSLIASSPKQYPDTARWAEAIHHQFSRMDGLLWTSNQCDPDTAYLFFGDGVASADFGVVLTRDGQTDAGFLSDVRQAGRRSGIRITV